MIIFGSSRSTEGVDDTTLREERRHETDYTTATSYNLHGIFVIDTQKTMAIIIVHCLNQL